MKSYVAILAVFVIALCSCSEDDAGGIVDNNIFNMVTYKSTDDSGSTFLFQGYNDSPVITLNAKGFAQKDYKEGRRIMLNYYVTAANNDCDKDVKVNYAVSTLFDSIRIASKDYILKYPSNPIRLNSIWRSGVFINLDEYLQYTGKKRVYSLIIDETTRNDATVEAYLLDNILDAKGTFYRRAYSSFFIGNLWRSPHFKTLRIYVNDESYPDVKFYEFSK